MIILSLRLCAQEARNWFQDNRQKLKPALVKVTNVGCDSGHHRIEESRCWQVSVKQVFSPDRIKQWSGLRTSIILTGCSADRSTARLLQQHKQYKRLV